MGTNNATEAHHRVMRGWGAKQRNTVENALKAVMHWHHAQQTELKERIRRDGIATRLALDDPDEEWTESMRLGDRYIAMEERRKSHDGNLEHAKCERMVNEFKQDINGNPIVTLRGVCLVGVQWCICRRWFGFPCRHIFKVGVSRETKDAIIKLRAMGVSLDELVAIIDRADTNPVQVSYTNVV